MNFERFFVDGLRSEKTEGLPYFLALPEKRRVNTERPQVDKHLAAVVDFIVDEVENGRLYRAWILSECDN